MTKLLLKLPWFISAPVIVALVAVLAIAANYTLSDYFERSFLDEASPLASAPAGASGAQPDTSGDTTPRANATAVATPTTRATEVAAATGAAATSVPATEPTVPPAPEPSASPVQAPAVIAQGTWQDGAPGHNGEGVAKIIRTEDGKLVLRVEEFSVTNGPDLFVVLSPDAGGYADGSLNLGDLKATDGNFNYEIPDGTDIAQYKSVVVWCRQFDITFAFATIEAV